MMYSYGPSHMAEQQQDDQLQHTYSSYVRIRDVALRTCRKRWTIGRSGKRGSGISVLAARHDDDDLKYHLMKNYLSIYERHSINKVNLAIKQWLKCFNMITILLYVFSPLKNKFLYSFSIEIFWTNFLIICSWCSSFHHHLKIFFPAEFFWRGQISGNQWEPDLNYKEDVVADPNQIDWWFLLFFLQYETLYHTGKTKQLSFIYIYIYIYICTHIGVMSVLVYTCWQVETKTGMTYIYIYSCVCIYIYIYIYYHPQTNCFVLSELFSVARHVVSLKLGSKPAQLYIRLNIRPLGQQVYHIS